MCEQRVFVETLISSSERVLRSRESAVKTWRSGLPGRETLLRCQGINGMCQRTIGRMYAPKAGDPQFRRRQTISYANDRTMFATQLTFVSRASRELAVPPPKLALLLNAAFCRDLSLSCYRKSR